MALMKSWDDHESASINNKHCDIIFNVLSNDFYVISIFVDMWAIFNMVVYMLFQDAFYCPKSHDGHIERYIRCKRCRDPEINTLWTVDKKSGRL